MTDQPIEFKQGDQVRLLTTRQVSYISHPPGDTVDPKGVWTVAAGVAGDLLLTKSTATIRIPVIDVQMYRKRESLDNQLRSILDGERSERTQSSGRQEQISTGIPGAK